MNILAVGDLGLETEELISELFSKCASNTLFTTNSLTSSFTELKRLHYDLLIAPFSLTNGSDEKKLFKARLLQPKLKILVLADSCDKDTVLSAVKSGATGFLLYGDSPSAIASALHQMDQGGALFHPTACLHLAQNAFAECVAPTLDILTRREKEVFRGIELGQSYKCIGTELNITPNTVHTHLKSIYGKLKAGGKIDALLKAKQQYSPSMH